MYPYQCLRLPRESEINYYYNRDSVYLDKSSTWTVTSVCSLRTSSRTDCIRMIHSSCWWCTPPRIQKAQAAPSSCTFKLMFLRHIQLIINTYNYSLLRIDVVRARLATDSVTYSSFVFLFFFVSSVFCSCSPFLSRSLTQSLSWQRE